MNLRSANYIIAKEVQNRALYSDETNFEDKDDVTSDIDNDSKPDFDFSDDNNFDPIISSDYIATDDNIEVDQADLSRKLSVRVLELQSE